MLKTFTAATAAIALVSTPVMAQASLADRQAAPIEDVEHFEGDNGLLLILLFVAAVIAGIIIIAGDDEPDHDDPVSP